MINIPSYIKDPSYRYQMPALQIKIEGRGNGIRTKLVNLFEVSKSLGVPPEYPLRYFGAEFGAIIEFGLAERKAILTGEVRKESLQSSLDHFIEKFVLCPKCKYPEIRIRIKKKELYSDCKACGLVKPMDMTHKISNFILRSTPTSSEKKNNPESAKKESSSKKLSSKSKKRGKTQEAITLKSPEILESLERLEAEDLSKSAECLTNLSISKDYDSDIKSYLLFKGIFKENLLVYMQNPDLLQLLKSNAAVCPEDFLMALATVYGLEEAWNQKISTVMFRLYENDIFSEELIDNWLNENLDFNEASPVFNPQALAQLKTNSKEFLFWLKNAEEEEKDEEEETKEVVSESNQKNVEDPIETTESKEKHQSEEEKVIENESTVKNNPPDKQDIMFQLKHVEDFSIDDI